MQTFFIAAATAVVAFVLGLCLGRRAMSLAVSEMIVNGRMRHIVEFSDSLKRVLLGRKEGVEMSADEFAASVRRHFDELASSVKPAGERRS